VLAWWLVGRFFTASYGPEVIWERHAVQYLNAWTYPHTWQLPEPREN
jgi:hypothetical protein